MLDKTRPVYTDYELKTELNMVFKSVLFADRFEKFKLCDSYFLNFNQMMEFARENGIDEKQYIRDIRDVVLTYPTAQSRIKEH